VNSPSTPSLRAPRPWPSSSPPPHKRADCDPRLKQTKNQKTQKQQRWIHSPPLHGSNIPLGSIPPLYSRRFEPI
jgi:hypothetical protein